MGPLQATVSRDSLTPPQESGLRALPQDVWKRLADVKLHAFLLCALEEAEWVVLSL